MTLEVVYEVKDSYFVDEMTIWSFVDLKIERIILYTTINISKH